MRKMRLTRPLVAAQGAPRIPGGLIRIRAVPESKGGDHLTITVSVALVLAIAVFVLCRYAGLRIWHAAVCVILGFYLASTSFAPYISQFTQSLIRQL